MEQNPTRLLYSKSSEPTNTNAVQRRAGRKMIMQTKMLQLIHVAKKRMQKTGRMLIKIPDTAKTRYVHRTEKCLHRGVKTGFVSIAAVSEN